MLTFLVMLISAKFAAGTTTTDTFETTDLFQTTAEDCEDRTMTVTGTIYADNWFKFWFNGELIHTDPYDFTPHNAEYVTFEAPVCGKWSFAIYATDYSDNVTGMEYDGNCIGDGGMKAMFSDGTVTSSDWSYKTIQYGPTNPADCLYGGEDWNETYYFTPPICKYNNDSDYVGDECTVDYYDYDEDWTLKNFDVCAINDWYDAVEYTDAFTGWGVIPSNCTQYVCPKEQDWSQYSDDGQNATFIWGPDLNFDNRILFKYTFYRNESGNYPVDYHCPVSNPDTGIDDGAVVGVAIGCMVGVPLLVVVVYCLIGDKSPMTSAESK